MINEARKRYNRQYWEKNKEEINARQRAYYKKNKEKVKKWQENYWGRKQVELEAEEKGEV